MKLLYMLEQRNKMVNNRKSNIHFNRGSVKKVLNSENCLKRKDFIKGFNKIKEINDNIYKNIK